MSDMNPAAFDGVLNILPYALRGPAQALPDDFKAIAEEIRLRVGQIPAVLLPDGESPLGEHPITPRDLECVFELASRISVHAVSGSIARGFITAPGGYRVGFCGTASVSEGKMIGFRQISSAALRIPREIKGAAEEIMPKAFPEGKLRSILIVSPPGGGKTTLLRDMIRGLSYMGRRAAVSDERGEIAAMSAGIPQMDLGPRTDVLDACPKAQGIMVLLRCMNPQVIAVDEITSPEDAKALISAANCGVKLLATAHGDGISDLKERHIYRQLLDSAVFDGAVYISVKNGHRFYEYEELGRGEA